MRYSLFMIFCLLLYGEAHGQPTNDSLRTKYLFKDGGDKGLRFSTFYGEIAPSTAFATIENSLGKMFMMEFGVHLNRKFSIGFYLARSPNTNVINVPAPSDPDYQDWLDAGVALDQLPTGATQAFAYFKHKGVNLAYMHKTERVLFWRGGLRFGQGVLELTANQKQLINIFYTSIFERKVYSINPEIGLGVNLRSWWRFHLDAGYQFVFSASDEVLNPARFNGIAFKFGFAFGDFSR